MPKVACDLCGESLQDYGSIVSLTDVDMITDESASKELWLCRDCTERLVKWLNANRIVRH